MSSWLIQLTRSIDTFLFNLCYRGRVIHLPYLPLVVNLEPTNYCNLRCPMCPVSQTHSDPGVSRGFMDMGLFERVARQLAGFRPMVAINLGGESTLHKSLGRMIRRLHRAGCHVFLDTNATRITEPLCEDLISSGLDEIVLCLDGTGDATSYEQIRQRASFEDTVQGIRQFLAVRRRMNATKPLVVLKNIQYFTVGQALAFPARLKALFVDTPPDAYRSTWADYWPGNHMDRLAHRYEVEPYWGDYRPCSNLWKKLAISWDGMVYACCLDLNRTTPVGNLTRQTVREVWNSPEMKAMRRDHRQGRQAEIALCRNCTMVRRTPRSAFAGLLRLRGERFTTWRTERK